MGSTDAHLAQYIDTFWGYGGLGAPYWFVGMEEGGGDSWPAFRDGLGRWRDNGAPPLDRFRPDEPERAANPWFGHRARIQPYWGRIIRLFLAAEGLACDTDAVRSYQIEHLAAPDGDTCLLELLPLPSPSTTHWIYGDHSDLDVLRDRATYRAYVAPKRVAALRALIDAHTPRYVVFVGLSYVSYWNSVAGAELPTRPERPVTSADGPTRMVITRHPSSFGVTNAYFEQIGRMLAGDHRTM